MIHPLVLSMLALVGLSLTVFIVHVTPGALQPTVTTIVDTNQESARP